MMLLGIDPGGREEGSHAGTGITVMEVADGKISIYQAERVHWDEWNMSGNLQSLLAWWDIDKVVYESFIPRWGQKFELDSVYLIGTIKAVVEPDMLVKVSPSAHKSLVKRDWAKQLVLDAGFPVDQGHAVDSTSLCLYYGITHQNTTVLEEYKLWLSKSS